MKKTLSNEESSYNSSIESINYPNRLNDFVMHPDWQRNVKEVKDVIKKSLKNNITLI